jgi:hypothetical protein
MKAPPVKQNVPRPQPLPVRIMEGDQLAAVVTTQAGQLTITPEPGWRVDQATINVSLVRERRRRGKKGEPCSSDPPTP